jgi:hypothetical protein
MEEESDWVKDEGKREWGTQREETEEKHAATIHTPYAPHGHGVAHHVGEKVAPRIVGDHADDDLLWRR